MTTPNFLCVGAQKAGTTTLYDILTQHPQIFLPTKKELHYFDCEEKFLKGEKWYFNNFEARKNEIAIGEITPKYMYIENGAKRIYDLLGKDIKLIFLLRNPVNRSFSHYLMMLKNGNTDKSFKQSAKINFIEDEKKFLNDNQLISKSLYDMQIQRFLQYFDKKNMFFIVFETEFLKNKDKTMNRLCEFLDVDEFRFNLDIQSNKSLHIQNKKINKVIKNDNIIKKISKFIFNDNTRLKIKSHIGKINRKEKINYEEREEFRAVLNEKIFYKSIKNLEKIISKDLSFWHEKIK